MAPIRVIFMGSAGLSCPSLSALLNDPGTSVVAVATQPDRPKGRHLKLTPSPVKELALQRQLPVFQPEKARHPEFLEQLRQHAPDLIVVVAYGQILPQSILSLPRYGCINVHTSLLPKYRGAAPIQWAILNGESETGVTIMQMDAGLDTGPILAQETTPIRSGDTSASLHDRLAETGAGLLLKTIPGYVKGEILPRAQPVEGACYAAKIKKQDGEILWSNSATIIWNRVRGLTPWPGAFTWFSESGSVQRLKILRAEPLGQNGEPGKVLSADKDGIVIACGEGAIKISDLQLEGGKPMQAHRFLAGHKLEAGYFFSSSGAGSSASSQ